MISGYKGRLTAWAINRLDVLGVSGRMAKRGGIVSSHPEVGQIRKSCFLALFQL